MPEDAVIAVPQFIAREQYPRKRHHSFRIESDVEGESFFPDDKVLRIKHEDTDRLRKVKVDEHADTHIASFRSLDTSPRSRTTHAPALTQATK